jgi:hypothetical protein
VKHLLVLFLFSDIYASFYKETVINPASPISVLDPARRPEIERLVTNLRFFGNVGPRPSKDVLIHHQSIQNASVFPTNHLTALAWMLFPISQLPIINPNNVRLSDPLGKLLPEKLGKLIAVMARFANPYYNSYSPADDLLDIFSIFATDNAAELLKKYSLDSDPDLQEFYRYSLLEALNKYVGINYSMADLDNEEFSVSAEKKADLIANPHRLLAFVLSNKESHLLEIPGTEILRRDDETWFTEAELDLELQEIPKDVKHRTKYKTLGYKTREDYQIHAAVDMLYKAAKNSPNEVLALLAYYAWRKYPEKINDVVWASGLVNQIQYSRLMEVLSDPYSKADYQGLLAAFKAAENVDDFFENLTQQQQNLLLYGGTRYDALLMQDYGNVRVEHAGKNLSFANCAEMSLFNLTYLTQLVEDDQGTSLIRSANGLVESPLKSFWQNLADEDLSTTATRNAWTQMIVRKPGVIYRKGGCKRESWQEFSNANWAELNPGMLNQMRALFYLLGKPDEALNLNYADSTEETVAAAAFKLSRLLSGLGIEDTSQDDSLPFCLNIGKIENKSAAKDWFGELRIERNGDAIAAWHFQTNHSYLNVSSKQQVFDITLNTCNPLMIGQMVVVQPDFSLPYGYLEYEKRQQIYWAHLDKLKENDKAFASFFKQVNLANERLRRELGIWLVGCIKYIHDSYTFYDHTAQETKIITITNRNANAEDQRLVPYSEKLLWGMCPIDEGGELHFLNDSTLKILKHPKMQRLISFVDAQISTYFFDQYSQSCLAYRDGRVRLNEINPEFLVPENRIGTLYLNVWQENIPSAETDCWMGKPIPVDETLKILEALPGKLNCLESFCP